MSDPGAPFVDPTFHIYNSYVSDPPYQIAFTVVWTVFTGVCVLVAAPKLLRSIRNKRAWQRGVWENVYGTAYAPLTLPEKIIPPPKRNISWLWSAIEKHSMWKIPYVNLDLGQLAILSGYIATILICITLKSPLMESPNRAGFLAIAQLPAIFLFATKNGILSVLLGRGYEKLNFLHRWAGRFLFLSVTIHGSLWIHNDRTAGTPIIGSEKETLGVAAYGILGIIVLSSLPFVRKFAYQAFFIIHVLGYVSFFVVISYHTLYAVPWIFAPLAFYGLDLFVRMIRLRIKDAVLVAVDNEMTLIHVHNCDGGWIAGQHVQLRVFFSGRMFESHPLTILNSPSPTSCTSSGELILGARVCGDWTRALNDVARLGEKQNVHVNVMIDGPYGGSTVDIGEYDTALLVAGGSGITFTLGLLDDIVGRVVNLKRSGGERTTRIEFVWCIKSFGSISWFAPMLSDIAKKVEGSTLDLHVKIFVTCLCDPEAVPAIPNCEVVLEKPKVSQLLNDVLAPPTDVESGKRNRGRGDGGLAVAVSGPEALTSEAQNVVARVPVSQIRKMGGLALHTEIFSL
ncbi:iron reductase [Hysterangium stoloniferum]|nr:iron reductase [Hysterangium stoloniferum]